MIPELKLVVQTEAGPHVDIAIGDGDAVAYRAKGIATGEIATGIRKADQLRGRLMPIDITPQPVLMTHDVIWLSGSSTAWFESDEAVPLGEWGRTEPVQEDIPEVIEDIPDTEPTVTESDDGEPEEEPPQGSEGSLSELADMSEEDIAELRDVLQTVRTHGPMRVSDVVIALGWPRRGTTQAKALACLTTLQGQGLVVGEASAKEGPGRKPILWRAI